MGKDAKNNGLKCKNGRCCENGRYIFHCVKKFVMFIEFVIIIFYALGLFDWWYRMQTALQIYGLFHE
jgi:hypothetical protein